MTNKKTLQLESSEKSINYEEIKANMKQVESFNWKEGMFLARLVNNFINKSGYLTDVIEIRKQYIDMVSQGLRDIDNKVDGFSGKEQDKLNYKKQLLDEFNNNIAIDKIDAKEKQLIDYVLNDFSGFIKIMAYVLNIPEEKLQEIDFKYLPDLIDLVHSFLLNINILNLITKITQIFQTMTPE